MKTYHYKQLVLRPGDGFKFIEELNRLGLNGYRAVKWIPQPEMPIHFPGVASNTSKQDKLPDIFCILEKETEVDRGTNRTVLTTCSSCGNPDYCRSILQCVKKVDL